MSHRANMTRIKAVSNALGELKDKVVFVGGATVSLYAGREAEEARPTDDVDVLVEISSRRDFAELEEQLRKMGFTNDTASKFIGRYLLPGIIVDVMPIEESILGFSNKWYAEGFKAAMDYTIDERHSVKIFTAPYFIASKLEAFKHRGKNDGRLSSDFEDIIFVLDNRPSIWKELQDTSGDLKKYLKAEFGKLLKNRFLEEWVDAHTPSGVYENSTPMIMEELKQLSRK